MSNSNLVEKVWGKGDGYLDLYIRLSQKLQKVPASVVKAEKGPTKLAYPCRLHVLTAQVQVRQGWTADIIHTDIRGAGVAGQLSPIR